MAQNYEVHWLLRDRELGSTPRTAQSTHVWLRGRENRFRAVEEGE